MKKSIIFLVGCLAVSCGGSSLRKHTQENPIDEKISPVLQQVFLAESEFQILVTNEGGDNERKILIYSRYPLLRKSKAAFKETAYFDFQPQKIDSEELGSGRFSISAGSNHYGN